MRLFSFSKDFDCSYLYLYLLKTLLQISHILLKIAFDPLNLISVLLMLYFISEK